MSSISLSQQQLLWLKEILLYVLWYDEKVDDAEQSSKDERQNDSAGEVLVIQLMILKTHITPSLSYSHSVCLNMVTNRREMLSSYSSSDSCDSTEFHMFITEFTPCPNQT